MRGRYDVAVCVRDCGGARCGACVRDERGAVRSDVRGCARRGCVRRAAGRVAWSVMTGARS